MKFVKIYLKGFFRVLGFLVLSFVLASFCSLIPENILFIIIILILSTPIFLMFGYD